MAAPTINLDSYTDALVVLGTAGVVVPLVRRFGLSPILGYFAAGAILGPLALGSFKNDVPFLRWVTVIDAANVSVIADLGVVFLLFLIGLELSYQRLVTMRRLVFGLGSLQIALSTALIAGALAFAGIPAAAAVILASCLSLSSTAIVIEVLSNQRRMSTVSGRTSFSILLAQDMAVVPILMLVSILGNGADGSIAAGMVRAVVQAAIALVFIVVVGRLLLRPLFRLVAASGTSELFVAAILFVIVGTGVASAAAGMSMALGAFVAGLMLAETEYRKAIEATIEPFKGLLLGVFFFTVGMNIDFRELAREPLLLLAAVCALIAIKALLIIFLAKWYRVPTPAAVETGLLLGPGGEFAFVVVGAATAQKLVSGSTASFTLAVTSVTMALIPVLAAVARRLTSVADDRRALDPFLQVAPPADGAGRAIIVGYGRVGQVVCDLLQTHNVSCISTDRDPETVARHRRRNSEVYYGDATSEAFLKTCGVMDAAGVIVTIHDQAGIDEIVRVVRRLRPDVVIVSRARDAEHARHLYSIGVTDAVPETIEASLQLSEAALVGLGVPTGPVIASIHAKRDEFRRALLEAAGTAGMAATRSIKPKTSRPPAKAPSGGT